MIPKIIHLCWLSGDPYPAEIQKCLDTWKEHLPDYEIWKWSEGVLDGNDNEDENNLFDKKLVFDVNIVQYTAEAYEMKKYAFGSAECS